MTNLDPFFCKMSVSIWMREEAFFGAHFHFWGSKLAIFEGYGQFFGFEVPLIHFSGFEVPMGQLANLMINVKKSDFSKTVKF